MSLYSSTLPIKAPLKQQTKEIKSSKVNEICQKIRESIEAAGKTDIHCTTVVTSFARTNPPLIDAALQKIKDWKGKISVALLNLRAIQMVEILFL